MIVVTGGLGFIGQNLLNELVLGGISNSEDVYALDTKTHSLEEIYDFLKTNAEQIDGIFHLGAITDTTETDLEKFYEYNVACSIFIWNLCVDYNIPLIYASSAATYGDGQLGFDDEKSIDDLKPLNPYGWSKQHFDLWVAQQKTHPPRWYGLKFFNVYGYDESHKGKMSSVAFQLFNQLNDTGKMRIFKSHNPDFKDGEQLRDFVYVDDIVDVCLFLYKFLPTSGIYNVGTGKSRTFKDLAKAVYYSYHEIYDYKVKSFEDAARVTQRIFQFKEDLIYIDTPEHIREQYQYITEAKIDKLRSIGYEKDFTIIEDGVEKYIKKLKSEKKS